jgi:hypothetical protein
MPLEGNPCSHICSSSGLSQKSFWGSLDCVDSQVLLLDFLRGPKISSDSECVSLGTLVVSFGELFAPEVSTCYMDPEVWLVRCRLNIAVAFSRVSGPFLGKELNPASGTSAIHTRLCSSS